MILSDFNKKAAELCKIKPGYKFSGPFDPWNRDSDAMRLWDEMSGMGRRRQLDEHGGWCDATILLGDKTKRCGGVTRARAICRCVAAWMEWGEIEDGKK